MSDEQTIKVECNTTPVITTAEIYFLSDEGVVSKLPEGSQLPIFDVSTLNVSVTPSSDFFAKTANN